MWADAINALADAVTDPRHGFGALSPTLDGQPIQAVIITKEPEWLDAYGGSSVRELRHELLVPRAQLSAAPAVDALLVDGDQRYRVAEPAQWDGAFWRSALRPILAEPTSFLTANGAYFVLADGRRLEVAA